MSSLITQLYNLINEAYIIYDAMIKAEYSIGSIVKSDRFTGIVIKNRGRFGITVINENGHHDWAPGENLTKIKNIKEIPSNLRKRLLWFKYRQPGYMFIEDDVWERYRIYQCDD